MDKRPKTFGDCAATQGPCPWVGCKYHMLIDVQPTGSIKFNAGATRTTTPKRGRGRRQGYRIAANLPVLTQRMIGSKRGRALQEEQDDRILELLENQEHTCVLKVIQHRDNEPLTLDAVGEVLSITRERVRQIQTKATKKLQEEPDCISSNQ